VVETGSEIGADPDDDFSHRPRLRGEDPNPRW
jgi:hypothetical protein